MVLNLLETAWTSCSYIVVSVAGRTKNLQNLTKVVIIRPEKVFKRYDIRGKYPEELNEEFAKRIGKALGSLSLKNFTDEIVVCKDNKESSRKLKKKLIEGLLSTGIRVVDIGTGPTDYAAYSGMKRGCVSVETTSSHMPLNFNGFKFMYPEGNAFVNSDLEKIKQLFRSNDFIRGNGSVEKKEDMIEEYRRRLVKFSEDFFERQNKVVVDRLGGTAQLDKDILNNPDTNLIDITKDETPSIDPPNPKPEKLDRLAKKVEEEDADLGVAFDLDSDRIRVFYDGRFLSGDELFCILAQLTDGPIAASIDTTWALEQFGEVKNTRIGDPFLMEEAMNCGAKLAGEPNGHYAFTEFVPYPSGTLVSLILHGLDIEKRLRKVPDIYIERKNFEVENKGEIIDKIGGTLPESRIISDLDGLKFRHGNSTVLVRTSGNSEKIRIVVEGKGKKDVQHIARRAEEAIKSLSVKKSTPKNQLVGEVDKKRPGSTSFRKIKKLVIREDLLANYTIKNYLKFPFGLTKNEGITMDGETEQSAGREIKNPSLQTEGE